MKIYSFVVVLLFAYIFISCKEKKQEFTAYAAPTPSNQTGEQLAKTYCGSCHLYPTPDLLDKKTWKEGVLPKMYYRLGLGDVIDILMKVSEAEVQTILTAKVYPEYPLIVESDWKKIMDFYIENAPEKPILPTKTSIIIKNDFFRVNPIYLKNQNLPYTTLVKFNPSKKIIYAGNRRNQIEIFDLKGNKMDSISVESPPSDIDFTNEKTKILTMGMMDPNDQRKGKFKIGNQTILDSLQRPVHFSFGDLDQDQKQDLVLCSYGNEVGKLSWFEAETMKEHVLKPISGARNTAIIDLNNDKLLDIVVLMAQGREGIFVFYNKGNGDFREEKLLEFPPVYGSSFIEMADFNQDGFQDILYTNGDNADYSYSPKAYHGIRIYLNDGKNRFKESYFFSMHGASKAQALDFDLDGDLDIAAISFFPEKNSESFILLENQGKNQFSASTIKESKQGKWLVMDVADMDADGDKDIVLGSFLMLKPENIQGKLPQILILENRKK